MDEKIPTLIKRIVDYKWHGEDDYDILRNDIESVENKEIREKLLAYLQEAREFSERSILEKEVEEELLERWLLEAVPMKMKYKNGRYLFDIKETNERSDSENDQED